MLKILNAESLNLQWLVSKGNLENMKWRTLKGILIIIFDQKWNMKRIS